MEHVIPEGENLYPMYSVEYLVKDRMGGIWVQFHLTDHKWLARLYAVENWLQHRLYHKTRIRVL